jgi:diadenosine tetraphosphate (Ap4A) HIT family hydrolase
VSIVARLDEVRDQFGQASGVTGLNCFANDGTAARQETPHVHLHVYGRSRDEAVNPFELLARRLTT